MENLLHFTNSVFCAAFLLGIPIAPQPTQLNNITRHSTPSYFYMKAPEWQEISFGRKPPKNATDSTNYTDLKGFYLWNLRLLLDAWSLDV